jgi:hypothetical protein
MLFLAGGRLPRQVENLVWRPEMVFRCAVAIEAPFHALRLVLKYHPHLVDGTVAGIAAHTPIYMDRMVEVGEIGNSMNLYPVDGGSIAFAPVPRCPHRIQSRILRLDLLVASHARLHGGHIGMRSYLDEAMTVAAVHAKLLHVKIVLERDGLGRFVTDTSIFRSEIVGDSAGYGRPEHSNAHRQLPGKLIRPLWEEICHRCEAL